MSILITTVIGITSILISKLLFKNWFNHLSLYSLVWTVMIDFYELKLMNFSSLKTETWIVIVLCFISFVLGIMTLFSARALATPKEVPNIEKDFFYFKIFADDGRIVKYSILVFSIIGLLSALQSWYVLINKFGSITNVLINAARVYSLQRGGEISGTIPYIFIFTYLSIFLGGLYAAYKNKFSLFLILPLIAVVLKQISEFARAGILLGFFEFFITYFLFKGLLIKQTSSIGKNNSKKKIIPIIVFTLIMVIGATAVKTFRNPVEDFSASNRALGQFKGGIFISPSIYLYSCSHIGVLNKYFENGGEYPPIGQNTFFTIYNILSKFKLAEKPNLYQKGYYIPMWTNTATYIREIHADFGYWGIFLIPYLMGLIITYLWFKVIESKRIILLVVLTYLYVLIGFSFLTMISRSSYWFISLFALLVIIPLVEKMALINAARLNKI